MVVMGKKGKGGEEEDRDKPTASRPMVTAHLQHIAIRVHTFVPSLLPPSFHHPLPPLPDRAWS